MDPSLTFLQSYVNEECTLQVTAGEQNKNSQSIYLSGHAPNHGKRRVGRPAITYIGQLCGDAGFLPNDLPALMQDRDGRSDRLMNASASST